MMSHFSGNFDSGSCGVGDRFICFPTFNYPDYLDIDPPQLTCQDLCIAAFFNYPLVTSFFTI